MVWCCLSLFFFRCLTTVVVSQMLTVESFDMLLLGLCMSPKIMSSELYDEFRESYINNNGFLHKKNFVVYHYEYFCSKLPNGPSWFDLMFPVVVDKLCRRGVDELMLRALMEHTMAFILQKMLVERFSVLQQTFCLRFEVDAHLITCKFGIWKFATITFTTLQYGYVEVFFYERGNEKVSQHIAEMRFEDNATLVDALFGALYAKAEEQHEKNKKERRKRRKQAKKQKIDWVDL